MAAPALMEPYRPASAQAQRTGDKTGAPQAPKQPPTVDSKTPKAGKLSGVKDKLAAYRVQLEQHAWFRVLETTFKGFTKDKVTENAAAMTYYGVFSLFPLILLFMSLAALAMQSNEDAREQILGVVMGLLPQGQDRLRDVIEGVIKAKGVAAGFGIVFLLWGALGWFQVIDSNINEIWGVSKPRSFIKGKLFALAMVAGIGGVALSSFAATTAVHLIQGWTGDIPGSVFLWQVVVSLLSLLTMAGVFFVLYKFAPQRKIEFTDVWPGALVTAALWEVTRRLLAFYIEKNNMISGYGPIGAAMALLFWIYIASIIILVGAELCYAIAKERRHIPVEQEMEVVSPPGEQPTAKFAPQVGGGHYAEQDKDEPIKAEGAAPHEPELTPDSASPDGKTPHPASRPRYTGEPAPQPAWITASRAERARQYHAQELAEVAGIQTTGPGAAGGETDGDDRPKQIHLDMPLVAMAGVAVGFVLGWINKKDEA